MVWQAFMGGVVAGAPGAVEQGIGGFMSPMNRQNSYLANFAMPNELPGLPDIMRLQVQDRLDPERLRRLYRVNGTTGPRALWASNPTPFTAPQLCADAWQAVYESQLSVPTPGETLDLMNRRWITQVVAERYLKQAGFGGAIERSNMLALRHQIPGPSDLISFALKEGWDAQVVERFQYDAEFPTEFRHWMQLQGYNQDDPRPEQIRAESPWVPWPSMYWRVHWANISPGQAYEMYQRLRANRISRFQVNGLDPRVFSLADLRSVLKVNDYPVPFRDQLAALAYRTPRLTDLDHMYHLRIIDAAELYEQHLDLGYNPTDADNRQRYLVAEDNRKRRAELIGNVQTRILDAYRVGSMNRREAGIQLYREHWQGSTLLAFFEQGDDGHRDQIARTDANIQAALNGQDAKRALDEVKVAVRETRLRYKRGLLNRFGAGQILRDIGITPQRADDYVQRWTTAFRGPRALGTLAQWRGFYIKHLVPEAQFRTAMTELGIEANRQDLIISSANRDIAMDVARAQEKAAKTVAAQQAAQLRQAKLLQQQHQQAIAQLTRQATEAKLTRWATRGIITEAQYVKALQDRDYLASTIQALVADMRIARAEYLAKKAKGS